MENLDLYIKELFNAFVFPGLMGGFLIGFSMYLISLGCSLGYKLIFNSSNNYEFEEI